VAFFGSKVPSLFAYKRTNDYYELQREGKQCKKKERKKKVFLKESLCDRVLEEDMMQKIFEIFFFFF
jgi:hypothetical protein